MLFQREKEQTGGKIMNKMVLLLMLSIFTLSCRNSVTAPAVENFELEKYLGVWYEVARLPNRLNGG